MFIGSVSKNKNSLINEFLRLIACQNGYWNRKINKCIFYSSIKHQYNYFRKLFQNDASNKEELTSYQKHIRLIIIIVVIILVVMMLVGSIFLIIYIIKKCKKKKEAKEALEANNKKIPNSKMESKDRDKMTFEMRNIFSKGNSFLRSSNPIPLKRNKTFLSSNPISLNSVKFRSCCNIQINANNQDKIINKNIEEERTEEFPKSNNEYSNYTFRSSNNSKDSDLEEAINVV